MRRITLFSWGYWGWGNATRQFVNCVDAVEKKRGHAPPIFVDIRYNRGGRANGFHGPSFINQVGPSRYCWMRSLGNRRIATKTGPRIKIHDPHAVSCLLDLAIEAAKENRRVIFFCACLVPGFCHRKTVASLVLKRAQHRGIKLTIERWIA